MKNKSCGYFKWYDESMNERAREVINELKEENKRLVAENWNFRNSGRRNIEDEVTELWAELKKAKYKQEGELSSARRKMRVVVYAALFSWLILLIFVYVDVILRSKRHYGCGLGIMAMNGM